jgi:hypothetical protein
MEEERVLGLCVLDEPLHPVPDVGCGGPLVLVDLIISQQNRVLVPETVVAVQKPKHVACVIDAPEKLVRITKVVDADQQRLLPPRAGGGQGNHSWDNRT